MVNSILGAIALYLTRYCRQQRIQKRLIYCDFQHHQAKLTLIRDRGIACLSIVIYPNHYLGTTYHMIFELAHQNLLELVEHELLNMGVIDEIHSEC